MVISLKDEVTEYEPYGRSVMPSVPQNQRQTKQDNLEDEITFSSQFNNLTINHSFTIAELDPTRDLFRSTADVSNVKNSHASPPKEFWRVRKSLKGEEELYVSGNSIIVSYRQADSDGMAFLDRTYTFEESILDAVWCNFIRSYSVDAIMQQDLRNVMQETVLPNSKKNVNDAIYPKFSMSPIVSAASKAEASGPPIDNEDRNSLSKSLCAMDKYSIHILTEGGDHFIKSLQFQVGKIMPTNFGLLLERKSEADDYSNQFPTLFFLSNPLKEIVPVLMNGYTNWANGGRTSEKIGYVTKPIDITLVDVVAQEDFVVFYSSRTKSHVIFLIRPINSSEIEWIQKDVAKLAEEEDMLPTTPAAAGSSSNLSGLRCRSGSVNSPFFVSTPVSSGDGSMIKKRVPGLGSAGQANGTAAQRLTYSMNIPSPPITRSMSSVCSPLSRTPKDLVGVNRAPSPTTTSTARLDSAHSPALNFYRSCATTRLLMDVDPELRSNIAGASNDTSGGSHYRTKTSVATPIIMKNNLNQNNVETTTYEPIIAEFALEFIWSESLVGGEVSDSSRTSMRARKVFVTIDFLGQHFLVLVVGDALKLIKFDRTLSTISMGEDKRKPSKQYIFGTTKVLNVRDAEPLESLNMLLVLDELGSLTLYSGLHKVALVNLHNLPTPLLSLSEASDTTAQVTPVQMKKFPRRLEFASDPRQSSFDIEFVDLTDSGNFTSKLRSRTALQQMASSPIVSTNASFVMPKTASVSLSKDLFEKNPATPEANNVNKIAQLRDSIDNRVTLETWGAEQAKLHRVTLPVMATTFLVDKCLAALRTTLPKDVAFSLIKTWYSFRNSITSDEIIPETILFKLCLLSMIGYDLESAKEAYGRRDEIAASPKPHESSDSKSIVVDSSVEIGHSVSIDKEVVKRMKIDATKGSDDDWQFLLDHSPNLHGLNVDKARATNLKRQKSGERRSTRAKGSKKTAGEFVDRKPKPKSAFNFADPGELLPHLMDMLTTLHLVYEDLKLVEITWSTCKSLVDLLYLFASDLGLKCYQDHYSRDFPSICASIETEMRTAGRAKLGEMVKKLQPHSHLNFYEQPPSIFALLHQCLEGKIDSSSCMPFPYIGLGVNRWHQNGAVDNGSNIITNNIFNVVLLFSNLANNQTLVEPHQVLRCLSTNGFLVGVDHICAGGCINVDKLKQISLFFPSSETTMETQTSSTPILQQPLKKKRRTQPQALLKDEKFKIPTTTNNKRDPQEKILFLMSALGITQEYLKQLPLGVSLPLWQVIFKFRETPKTDWCSSIYSLIDRPDLLSLEYQQRYSFGSCQSNRNGLYDGEDVQAYLNDVDEREIAYLDLPVLRLLFPNDQRLQDAYRLMIASRPMPLLVEQKADESDTDFLERRAKHLCALAVRMMAMALGRGMITLRSYAPVVAEKFPIPPLVLMGKVAGKSSLVDMGQMDLPPNMTTWPLFHNGVAAGLRIHANDNKLVDSSWILFNKPSNNMPVDDHYAHAGFLFSLGLNGLLDNLNVIDFHDYVAKGNDLTKVAVLLGLAASKRGTMDSTAYVLLGIHLDGLLPATTTAELDVPNVVKVAAVLGVGLLFQSTGHVHVAEVLLSEIGRQPVGEMEHTGDRESYALSAGLAFGLVTLGRGDEMIKTITPEGLTIPDQLAHYMAGVHKRPCPSSTREKVRLPLSSHVCDGDYINADVTSPGATLALGMMFFATGNRSIAQWLAVPETQNLLETIRPDFILLRVLAKNLILWNDIRAQTKWIESQIPKIIYHHAFGKFDERKQMARGEIDFETMSQSYCNIIAGACFVLALRYAGSADVKAFEVCREYAWKLVEILSKGEDKFVEQAGASTIESCINVTIVSCAIIMAGTGNLEVFRLCRFLRSRVGKSHVLYGSFMAVHMALGLLFLGGCRMTLNSRPESVAALLCAFFPKYPVHTSDNRYHLQAFRHLYVLATEPRLLVPRCISSSGVPVYAKIRYRVQRTGSSIQTIEREAPCLLPELCSLASVELIDPNYWNISFEADKNFGKLKKCLQFDGNLFIKRRVRCLSYNREFIYFVGPGSSSSSTIMKNSLDRKSFSLFDLTNEVVLKSFSEVLFSGSGDEQRAVIKKNRLAAILYDCAEDETLELFPPLVKFISAFDDLLMDGAYQKNDGGGGSAHKLLNLWQLKLMILFIRQAHRMSKFRAIEIIKLKLERILKESIDAHELETYLGGNLSLLDAHSDHFIDGLVYFNFPFTGSKVSTMWKLKMQMFNN